MFDFGQMPRPDIPAESEYVIVGAGSAGCVLANRISAAGHSVTLLEAGPRDRNLLIHIPAGVYSVFKNPSLNWNYQAEPDQGVNGREVELPRGKVVGGSSSINAMIYMRGHPLDYDRWAERYGLPQWKFENCLPYFKTGESSDRGPNDWRGDRGPLGVTKSTLENPLYDALWEAGATSGQGCSDDLNGFAPEGIARLDSTTRGGRRCSAAVAHLRPAMGRPGMNLITGARVHRVTFEKGRATGIRYSVGNEIRQIHATREVILSAGAINSPWLLKLSGVGPERELRRHGIDPVHVLPGVGRNLQDHLSIDHVQACTKRITLDYLQRPWSRLRVGMRWMIDRGGVAASNIWEMGGLVYSTANLPHPNIQYHFALVWPEYEGRSIRLHQAWTMTVDQLRPFSRGDVLLKSADPAQSPMAKFNYLSDPRDLRELMDGLRRAEELFQQRSFDDFRGPRIRPGPRVKTDEELAEHVRDNASTDYHPCGTCRMGNDDMAVVDEILRVRGVGGLRVVDASVMPDVVSGNLNAPTLMIADRASDFILERPSLAPFRPRYHFDP